MRGKGCLSQQLKEEELYLSRRYCLIRGTFSRVGEHGNLGGETGGTVRLGQEQGWSPGWTTPVLVHLTGPLTATTMSSSMPTLGKSTGTTLRAFKVERER